MRNVSSGRSGFNNPEHCARLSNPSAAIVALGRRPAVVSCPGQALRRHRATQYLKPIEDVSVGDLVWAWDDLLGYLVRGRVKRLFRHKAKPVLDVSCTSHDGNIQTIHATPEHPFWVESKGWVAANELKGGDALKRCDGASGMRVQRLAASGTADVFNFEVEGKHNYFVGRCGVLVHNESGPPSEPTRPSYGRVNRNIRVLTAEDDGSFDLLPQRRKVKLDKFREYRHYNEPDLQQWAKDHFLDAHYRLQSRRDTGAAPTHFIASDSPPETLRSPDFLSVDPISRHRSELDRLQIGIVANAGDGMGGRFDVVDSGSLRRVLEQNASNQFSQLIEKVPEDVKYLFPHSEGEIRNVLGNSLNAILDLPEKPTGFHGTGGYKEAIQIGPKLLALANRADRSPGRIGTEVSALSALIKDGYPYNPPLSGHVIRRSGRPGEQVSKLGLAYTAKYIAQGKLVKPQHIIDPIVKILGTEATNWPKSLEYGLMMSVVSGSKPSAGMLAIAASMPDSRAELFSLVREHRRQIAAALPWITPKARPTWETLQRVHEHNLVPVDPQAMAAQDGTLIMIDPHLALNRKALAVEGSPGIDGLELKGSLWANFNSFFGDALEVVGMENKQWWKFWH